MSGWSTPVACGSVGWPEAEAGAGRGRQGSREQSRLYSPGQSPPSSHCPCTRALEGRCQNINLGSMLVRVAPKSHLKAWVKLRSAGLGRLALGSQRHLQGQEHGS